MSTPTLSQDKGGVKVWEDTLEWIFIAIVLPYVFVGVMGGAIFGRGN
jgi:hypothetical protein